jgi:hypothetical protein
LFQLTTTACSIMGPHKDSGGTLTVLNVHCGHKTWTLYNSYNDLMKFAKYLVLMAGSQL